MPPIDPRLIPPQPGIPPLPPPDDPMRVPAGTTLAGPSMLPPVINRTQQQANTEAARLAISQAAESRTAGNEAQRIQLERDRQQQSREEFRAKYGYYPDQPPKAGTTTDAVGPDAIADLTPAEQNVVKGITQGRVPITSFALGRNPQLYRLVQRAFQYEPGTDLAVFARRQAAYQKFMSNPNSPMLRVNQALQHLGRFAINAQNLDNFHSGIGALANYPKVAGEAVLKSPSYEAFANDRDALATELAAAFQGSGQSALADRNEWKKRLSAANSPESFDKIIHETVQLLGGRVEASNAQFKQAVGANADFYDLMSPGAKAVFDKYSDQTAIEPDTEKQLSTTEKEVKVPEGYQEAHAGFLKPYMKGGSLEGQLTPDAYKAIREKLDQQFFPGQVRSHYDPGEIDKFVNDFNKVGRSNKIPGTNVPTNAPEAGFQRAIQSGPSTGIATFGNAASGGLADLAIGQSGREAKDLAEQEHPGYAIPAELAGSVAGMATLDTGMARLAAKLGVKPETLAIILGSKNRAKLAADAGTNALYGGMRGYSGADEGHGLSGALEGTAAGAIAAPVGNVVSRGLAQPFLNDRTVEALAKLRGVKMSTLQRLGLGRTEEALTSVPGAHGAREASLASYNIDDANRTLGLIGQKVPKGTQPGTDLNAVVNNKINEEYSKLRPLIFGPTDGQFDSAWVAIQQTAKTKPQKQMMNMIRDAVNQFRNEDGLYNGDGYQAASTRLRTLIKEFSNSDEIGSDDMARAAEQARKQMQFQVQRQSAKEGSDVGTRLKNVERAYAQSMISEDASRRALANSDAVYSPSQKLTSTMKFDTSKNKGMSARGKALDQPQAEAAANILGRGNVPKLSARETAIVGGVLGTGSVIATSAGAPVIPIALGSLAAGLYGPGVKQVVQKILVGRPVSFEEKSLLEKTLRRATSDYTRHSMTGD